MSIAELLHRLDEAQADAALEGVTLLGGEPFEQAAALAMFATEVRRRGLGVIVFTGCLLEALRQSPDAGTARLLHATDLLVDGPFDRGALDQTRRWIGSTNQRVHHLTDRYPRGLEWPTKPSAAPERIVELRISPSGHIHRSGWPD